MSILVTGSTGTVGSQVVQRLAEKGARVHALARDPGKARFPEGVTVVKGDMLDVASMRAALAPVSTLFLLNAVTPDELTQALIALNLAREAGIKRIVYLSVIHSDRYANVPHFAGKLAAEQAIAHLGLPATILRPSYFIENDKALKDALLGPGVYPQPVGSVGLAMVDTRDIADIAVSELLRREQAQEPLPSETMNVVGPDLLTGEAIARIWSEALGRKVAYGGDDTAAFEQHFSSFAPGWMAYDMRLMLEQFLIGGNMPNPGDTERLTKLLGRKLRSYRDFAAEMAAQWKSG